LAAADFVVAPSRAMLQAIHLNYGTLCRSDVIPNGRAPRLFRSGPKEPFVLTAGRFWDRAKNLETLDRAAAKLDWPVYAAGEARSAESIRCLGPLSAGELRHWFARASIYALPARYEPFGLSILEAALSGCALVLGDIPSLRENWDGAAVFVPPDDVHGLVEQIRLLARHEDVRRGFQQAARKRAVNFSLDRMTDAYLERYAALRCLSQPAAVFRS
jgi:glycosyltransferase involved in cell wall biosynthesis